MSQYPRCLKTFIDHVGIHTCTPTHEWREMEQELSRQKEINVKLVEALKLADAALQGKNINMNMNVVKRWTNDALAGSRPQSMDNGQENLIDSEKSSEKVEV